MDLPEVIPVMTLPNAVLFPHETLPLYIFEPRYRKMLADVLEGGRIFCIARRLPESAVESPARVAGVGLVRASVERPDETSDLVLHGLARVELREEIPGEPYRVHRIRELKQGEIDEAAVERLIRRLRGLVRMRIQQGFSLAAGALGHLSATEQADLQSQLMASLERLGRQIEFETDLEKAIDLTASSLLTNADQRQVILETRDLRRRVAHLISFLGC